MQPRASSPRARVVRDEARIEDVISKVKAAARDAGVPESLAEPVWRELVERSIQHELTVWDATREPQRKVR